MQLREFPIPKPGPHDVLIRMHGAEVGDWDDLVRQGGWPMGRPVPLVLGLAGAGRVADLGPVATGFAEDEPVWAYNYPMLHEGCPSTDHNGVWAEYMLVPDAYAATAPASLDLTQAGAVPIVGLAAHETLIDILEVQQGDIVLITAAAGGVGHLAVQIATRLGAEVVAPSSPLVPSRLPSSSHSHTSKRSVFNGQQGADAPRSPSGCREDLPRGWPTSSER